MNWSDDMAAAPRDGRDLVLSKWSWVNDTSGMEVGSEAWRQRIFEHDAPRKYTCHWICKGHWSKRFKNWNDGVEPSGLNGPTHWAEITPPDEEDML